VNVLFVCHRLPYPPRRGGKIRPFNMIKHLAAAGHSVTVASLARSQSEADEGRDLRKYCADVIVEQIGGSAATARMLARLPTTTPSSFGYFYSPRLEQRIRSVLARDSLDVIIVHCSSVAPYVASAPLPKLLDFGDMDSQKWLLYARHRALPLGAGFWLEGRKLERTEKKLARSFDLCTCTTREELATLRGYGVSTDTDWFPNGVDATYFSPTTAPYDPDRICFVGRMDYFPNQQAVQWFCADVLPLIRQQRPGAVLEIVGAAPPRSILALASADRVVVTGTVPDVRPLVHKSAVTVAPLIIARGTQNKILEAMAMGVPVVASSVAARGVDAEPGRHLLAADSPRDFAAAVLGLLESSAERRRLADAGRERVLSNHSWAASLQRFDGIVDRLRARSPVSTRAAKVAS
jgi:sugar transferase (PEP-CTERM/EpsH1 system associated)